MTSLSRAWQRAASGALLTAAVGCSPAAPPADQPVSPATGEPAPSSSAQVASTPAEATIGPDGDPCGALGCTRYGTVEDAFRKVLAEAPLVLAVGESHAQKGSEDVASATKRFQDQLLPLLKDRASDIVLELMVADGKCGESEKQVAKNVEKPVTQTQAKSNKNEFVVLAETASKLQIRPHVLHPNCDDYLAVAKAGPDGIMKMLTMIASLSGELVMRILDRNQRTAVDKMVLAYGGAMHNDLQPAAGREAWSFGPGLQDHTKGRYVALDLIVPEFIKDNDTWRSLPWYEHYDRARLGDHVTLFQVAEHSYVLVFPLSSPAP